MAELLCIAKTLVRTNCNWETFLLGFFQLRLVFFSAQSFGPVKKETEGKIKENKGILRKTQEIQREIKEIEGK